MAWIYLIIGGILEIGFALGLKFSKGFTALWPSIATIVTISLSFFFFSQAMKKIPVGTAYAIFTGIGASGIAVVGMAFLGENVSLLKLIFIALLLICIIGLKLTSNQSDRETQ